MTLDRIQVRIGSIELTLQTHPQLFSPRRVDAGTLAMLEAVRIVPEDKLLDLGCGYGVVGLYAARLIGAKNVFLIDSDPVAVSTARKNAEINHLPELSISLSDGFQDFDESGFTKILCNPPYHSDFSVAKHFILKGFNRLQIGGELCFVTKREKWYRNKLRSVFGGAKSRLINSYYVISAVKKRMTYAKKR